MAKTPRRQTTPRPFKTQRVITSQFRSSKSLSPLRKLPCNFSDFQPSNAVTSSLGSIISSSRMTKQHEQNLIGSHPRAGTKRLSLLQRKLQNQAKPSVITSSSSPKKQVRSSKSRPVDNKQPYGINRKPMSLSTRVPFQVAPISPMSNPQQSSRHAVRSPVPLTPTASEKTNNDYIPLPRMRLVSFYLLPTKSSPVPKRVILPWLTTMDDDTHEPKDEEMVAATPFECKVSNDSEVSAFEDDFDPLPIDSPQSNEALSAALEFFWKNEYDFFFRYMHHNYWEFLELERLAYALYNQHTLFSDSSSMPTTPTHAQRPPPSLEWSNIPEMSKICESLQELTRIQLQCQREVEIASQFIAFN